MKAFEKLIAWQASHKLVLSTYRITTKWPIDERYGLTSQARRAAFSTAANLAEGSAKRTYKDFRRFIDTAIGSLAELCYIIKLARELGILSAKEADALEALRDEAGKLTWGLYRHISKRA